MFCFYFFNHFGRLGTFSYGSKKQLSFARECTLPELQCCLRPPDPPSHTYYTSTPTCKTNFPKTKAFIIFRVQESFSSDTDAAAGAAAGTAATAAAFAAAFVVTTVFAAVATVAAAEAAAVAAAPAAALAVASVSEEKASWILNIINQSAFVQIARR